MNSTNNTLYPTKSSTEPRFCPCPSMVETSCSRTRSVFSRCPSQPFPRRLDSRNKRKASFLTSLTRPTIKTTWDLYPTKSTTTPKACQSNALKNSTNGTMLTSLTTSLISKPNFSPTNNRTSYCSKVPAKSSAKNSKQSVDSIHLNVASLSPQLAICSTAPNTCLRKNWPPNRSAVGTPKVNPIPSRP